MSFDKNILVGVGTDALPVDTASFTMPLHLTDDVTFPEAVREYRGNTEAVADTTLGVNAKAAVATHFSQELHAPAIKIGRADTVDVAQVITWAIGGAPAEDDVVAITVGGVTGSYTAGVSPTDESVAAGLRAALTTALADEDVTVSGATVNVIVTADVKGESFSYSSSYTRAGASTGTITPAITAASAGIEDDLAAILAEDPAFFGVTLGFTGTAADDKMRSKVVARWAQANDRLFLAQSSEAGILDKTGGNLAEFLSGKNYSRVGCVYHDDDEELVAVAAMAFKFEADPDIKTTFWAYTPLVGITVPTLSSTEESNIEDQNCNYVSTFGGRTKFGMGVLSNGRPIDVIITLLWYAARLKEAYIQLLSDVSARNDKVDFDDKHLQALPNAGAAVNAVGERVRHFVAGSTDISVLPVADTPAGLRAERRAVVTATGMASGAVERVTVTAYIALP